MAWDPAQYLKFSDERLRPGFDLLARVGELPAGAVVDLGCGTGVHACAMAERWPERAVLGVDTSPEMLRQAQAAYSRVRWIVADLQHWMPEAPPALIFSNAVLQWVDRHDALLPQLMAALAPDGVMALQMPRNFDAPSHVLMRETAVEGPWAPRLEPLLRHDPVGAPAVYYDLLVPLAKGGLDIWETEYLHVLSGEDAVLNWVRGTALRPLLDPLTPPERAELERLYAAKLRKAYPKRANGKTLLPFRRIFIVARR